jgi:enoyl-CoA hydratase
MVHTMEAEQPVLLDQGTDGIYVLTLNRPKKLNALHSSVIADMAAKLKELRRERARAVVVVGKGAVFCAGADIDELSEHPDPQSFSDYLAEMLELFSALATYPFLTIAGIHGAALGGGLELALACDLRVMTSEASLGLPEIALGALPGGGGIARSLQLLPAGVARELVLLGRRLDAERALQLGLITAICEPDTLLATCTGIAKEVPTVGREALSLGKLLMSTTAEERTGPQSQWARAAISQLTRSDLFASGINEFQSRRKSKGGHQ